MREWLVDLVGEGMAPVASFVLAAAIVVILVFIVIWVAKRALGGQIGNRAKGRGPRLAVMDVTAIDPKRKLVLVRRDEVEHLILIGGQNDVVIEANILRVAAGARTTRTEPSFRPDEAPAGERRPAAAPQRLAAPAPTAPLPAQRKPAGEPTRDGAPAVVSPLARAVPRAPVAAEDNDTITPAEKRPEKVVKAEPAVSVPLPAAPEVQPIEAERREPSFSVMPPAPPAPPAPVADRSESRPSADEKAAVVAPSAPPVVTATRPDAPSRPDAVPVPQVVAARATAEAVPPATERARPVAPAPEERPTARPVQSDRAMRFPPAEPAGPSSVQPLPRTPVTTNPVAAPQNGVPRVSITGAGEPVRRPAPVVAAQTRSMATPTYSPLSPQMFRQDGEGEAPAVSPAAAPEPVAERAAPEPADERSVPQPDVAEVRAERPSMMREMGPRAGEPSSAMIAAAERQRELIRARPTPTMAPRPAAEATAPTAEDADQARRDAPRQEPAAAEPATPAESASPVEATPDRKPLEVRSFAAAIQAGGRPMAAPVQVPVRTAPVPVSRPAEPVKIAAAAAPIAVAAPEKAAATGDDAFAGLDDFLSAELDFGLDDVHWNDEPASPAPEVRVDEPSPAEKEAEKPARALSLEEEMERLLGDFNFETSDRGRR